MNPAFKHGFFIVGVRKCGTTTVFDFLKNTGAFQACHRKEPQFFCLPDAVVAANLGWYAGLFGRNDNDRPWLDGSTLYYQYPASRERITARFAAAKFVVCLRDPARRMFSAYWHQRAKPGGVETRNFDEILDGLELTPGQDLWAIEQANLEKAVAAGRIHPRDPGRDYHRRHYGAPFATEGLDELAFFRYAGESLYSRQAAHWPEGPDLQLIFFENLLRQPEIELRRLADFAGLSPEQSLVLPANRNKTYDAARLPWLGRLARAGIFDALKRRAPDAAKHFFKEKFLPEAARMTDEQYARARRLLAGEYEFWFAQKPELTSLWR